MPLRVSEQEAINRGWVQAPPPQQTRYARRRSFQDPAFFYVLWFMAGLLVGIAFGLAIR